jgi:hypothetical protein
MSRIARYVIWNGIDIILTLGRDEFGRNVNTPDQWKEKYPFAAVPGKKCIIHGGTVNGQICEEYDGFVQLRQEQGAPIELDGSMTDREILDIIEIWEDSLNELAAEAAALEPPGALERLAAAVEAQVMLATPDIEE